MYRRNMKRLIKEGMNPLTLSIRKWKDMIYRNGFDFGCRNCALCATVNICDECIIMQHTGLYSCRDTPYEQWVHHHHTEHHNQYPIKIRCPECVRIVNQEIKFLERLKLKLDMYKLERLL